MLERMSPAEMRVEIVRLNATLEVALDTARVRELFWESVNGLYMKEADGSKKELDKMIQRNEDYKLRCEKCMNDTNDMLRNESYKMEKIEMFVDRMANALEEICQETNDSKIKSVAKSALDNK